jgi:pimeloyl-ACP methyl ester carboxylesterase
MHGIGFVREHPGSYVLAAPSLPPDSAIVFVHGFGGDSTSTWQHVQELIDIEPYKSALARTDLFFYDYECTRHEIVDSSDDLNRFLTQIFTDRESIHTGRVPYQSVHLIGHSAGAVVIRQLLIELFKIDQPSPYRDLLLDSNPVLFGSAQAGFKHEFAVLLVVDEIPFLKVAMGLWLLARNKVYNDLRPGSPVLTAIHDLTKELWTTERRPAFRPLTVWGKKEQVVHPVDLLRDMRIDFRAGKDHFSVCKPKSADTTPLQQIVTSMKEVPQRAAPK